MLTIKELEDYEKIIKICKKHGQLKVENCWPYKTKKGTKCYRCKLCFKENQDRFRKNNPDYVERYKETQKKAKARYVKNNKEIIRIKRRKYLQYGKEWRLKNKNTTKYKEGAKNRANKSTLNLSDFYVKKLITRHSILRNKDITKEMIELKRIAVLIKRNIKKLEEEKNGNS